MTVKTPPLPLLKSTVLLLTASLLWPISAAALSATQTIEKEVTVITADGVTQTKREAADTVVPGERIVYSLNILNDKPEPASDLVLTMPVPAEVIFVEGSADKAGASVVYSADGGASFAARPAAVVMDAAGTVRAASADDITHIRWTVKGPVAAGATDTLSFAAILK